MTCCVWRRLESHQSVKVRQLHLHFHGATAAELGAITHRLDTIIMNLAEAQAKIVELTATTVKIGNETDALKQRIADLIATIDAGVVTTPEFDAALAALEAEINKTDAKVEDEPAGG